MLARLRPQPRHRSDVDCIADTSAWHVSRRVPSLRAPFDERLVRACIGTCPHIAWELLYSTRDAREFDRLRVRLDALPTVVPHAATWARAFDVAGALGRRGAKHHRQVGMPDLVIAACAELAGIPLLHYDQHFELIAGVTGQAIEWIAPSGSI